MSTINLKIHQLGQNHYTCKNAQFDAFFSIRIFVCCSCNEVNFDITIFEYYTTISLSANTSHSKTSSFKRKVAGSFFLVAGSMLS